MATRRPPNSRLHPTARHVAGCEMIIPNDQPIAVPARRVNRRSRYTQGFSRFTVGGAPVRLHCSKATLYKLAPSEEELMAVKSRPTRSLDQPFASSETPSVTAPKP